MTLATPPLPTLRDASNPVLDAVRKYWGYTSLRPLQADAIEAGLDRCDSLVVLPTGGGKSLCYQVPPVVAGRTDIVVSPLISLMKDQVDALTACGYPAAALHGGLSDEERRRISARAVAGEYRLLFVAPERLLTPWFINLMQRMKVQAFSIDEAHCISQWGHDFRPEYRRLAALKQHFPGASVHAYTATATPRVRDDIVAQLGLKDPRVLVGAFDRPNLVYRVEQRGDLHAQVLETVRQHQGEAAIVYCISRAETEELATWLKSQGVRAAAYHAGLDARTRAATQEQFAAERIDVVVATVAFGMGIDRSNVRCVIHAAMPKSIEHYQQETGRAGRDGLEANCVLFFSHADARRWESIIRKSVEQAEQPAEVLRNQLELLAHMQAFASSQTCRHAMLSRYFGQEYRRSNCGACDVCLDDRSVVDNGDEIARAIFGCVKSLRPAFGAAYVTDVLRGAHTERIVRFGHDQLPQYGVLRSLSNETVRDFITQLLQQGFLSRSGDDRPVLSLTRAAQEAMQGRRQVQLRRPAAPRAASKPAPVRSESWEGVDRDLFERLRVFRRQIADERGVPAFVILSDASLRELATLRPISEDGLRRIRGLGEQKLADLGPGLLKLIKSYRREKGLPPDNAPMPRAVAARPAASTSGKSEAFRMFRDGASIAEVVKATGRAPATVVSYLEDYIAEHRPASIGAWVGEATYKRIEAAARRQQGNLLRPVYEALGGEAPYDEIRLVMKHAGLR